MAGPRRLTTNQRMTRGAGGRFTGLTTRAILRNVRYEMEVDAKLANRLIEIEKKLDRTAHKSLRGALYSVSQYAKASIVQKWKPSRPGQPVHTKRKPGKNVRAAIEYALDKEHLEGFVGPVGSKVSDVMALHEKGGDRPSTPKVEHYPKRPVMVPALERAKARFVGDWRGALG